MGLRSRVVPHAVRVNPLNPLNASKQHFASLKIDLISYMKILMELQGFHQECLRGGGPKGVGGLRSLPQEKKSAF